jgi:DNA-directed RNA polymerase subunit RPC12/RpoP
VIYKCSVCEAQIEAEDLDDLTAKGWSVLYAGSTAEGTETIQCPRCFERGVTISPVISPLDR